MIQDVVFKLEETLVINPRSMILFGAWEMPSLHKTFLIPDQDEAKFYFDKAAEYFQQAVDEDPTNELYQKSLEVVVKAPELRVEIHKQGFGQQLQAVGPSSSFLGTKILLWQRF
ncbi:hypothetical protein TanjilG_16948 [Lupinus angustifolius]|uniref:mitochondrial import receptor subunit TOM20-like n=1 Tax=Lupinus angustifolius TaxID=3871 RepID=UPI00090D4191|nr:PREDICTED: mitochondrial import receptor subunit TOM20-like [Lupinus angustifolius]OIV90988.1 hypothetical protein TanjilG_16948 [Lupinus angustifolius]